MLQPKTPILPTKKLFDQVREKIGSVSVWNLDYWRRQYEKWRFRGTAIR